MKIRRSVTMDPELWAAATGQAHDMKRSFSWLAETALRHYLKRLKIAREKKSDARKLQESARLTA